jgi:hypothetical protein
MTSDRASSAKKDAIVVLGMHRSGTSSVAGTVAKLGATPPKSLMPANFANSRGHWESNALVALNDAILKSAGSVWDDWRTFNPAWYASPVADEFYKRAADELKEEFGNAKLVVLKDPRMCRMLPFWSKVLNGYSLRFILPVRSPLEVSRSLWMRDKIPINKGVLMWLRHILDAEMASSEMPRAFIDWNSFIVDWRLVMARTGEQIGVSWPSLSDKAASEIDQFLSPDLRHHFSEPAELAVHPNVNEWIKESYGALLALATDPILNGARQTLNEIRLEFDKASKMFGGAVGEVEQHLIKSLLEIEATNCESKNFKQAAEDERERLSVELAGYVDRTNALSAERDAFQLQLKAAETRVLQQSELTARLELQVQDAERLAKQQENIMGGQIESLRASLNEAVMQRDSTRAIVRQQSAIMQRLRQELNGVQEYQESLQGKLLSAQQSNDELQGTISSTRQQNVELQGKLSSAEQRNEELRRMATVLGEQNRALIDRNEKIVRVAQYIPASIKRSLKLLFFRSSLRF